jgi:hypothetical protein
MMDASEKQISFIRNLAEQKYGPEKAVEFCEKLFSTPLHKRDASSVIDNLMSLPRYVSSETKARIAQLSEGFYRADSGDIIRLKASRSSGNLYGMLLNPETHKFEYAPGIMRGILPENRMTLEDVAAYGLATHHCMVCGKQLTKKASQDKGIGPVCAKRV